MIKCNEMPKYKALHFDLKIRDLEKHYSFSNPKGAYSKIQKFLSANKFSHEQYSGYHSVNKTTDTQVFFLIKEMRRKMPWLSECTNRFEVTDIGDNYDLMDIIVSEPTQLS